MTVLLAALWLGILTSVSPCPLATNVAAISFLSKKINHPKAVLWSGIVYTLGRMVTYAILGILIITSLANIPTVANFLQKYMNRIIGPLVFVAGLFLLDVIKLSFSGFSVSHEKQNMLARSGVRGSFALGVIFALSFCPISAALFFGSLIPLALKNDYRVIFPCLYGIGTGLPVIIFAIGLALGVTSVSRLFNRITHLEQYMRKITGVIFLFVGVYYIWNYIVSLLLK